MPGSITLITPQTDLQPPLVKCCSNPISVTCRAHHHFVADFQGFSHAKQLVLTRTRRRCFTNFALGPRTLGRSRYGSSFRNRGDSLGGVKRKIQVQALESETSGFKAEPGCPRLAWGAANECMKLMFLFGGRQASLEKFGSLMERLKKEEEEDDDINFLGRIFQEGKPTGGQYLNELTFSDFP